MTVARWCRLLAALLLLVAAPAFAADDDNAVLAKKVQAMLKANCYRCHGQEGVVEGGMNYVLDLDKLVQRKKIVPGQADKSPLFKRVVNNIMPPGEEQPRPSDADRAVLRQWIEAGAPKIPATTALRVLISEADVMAMVLADLETIDKRSRRFTRYFSIAHLYNAGLGEDELHTHRNALSKLINSLSWHPRVTIPKAIDPAGTVLRIDLRDYVWDANLWNRLLVEYPYGIFQDSATAKAVSIATATRMPWVRADWFVAVASRAPVYYDLLQTPANVAELERQLRVDVAVDIQQERVARTGFNGSGVSRNNRILERHDSVHGAYWRTYDFDGVPQHLIDRPNLLPDRRNIFAYPLGPGANDNNFQHAGGEVIYNLPNGLQAFMLINANGVRLDKANTAIVSDPKRPDRAVEAGLSCMSCHNRGMNFKSDQVRDFVEKNPKAFSRADAELIRALYVPEAKINALMKQDADRFREAVEKTGSRITTTETIMTMALRYEADVDLESAAAEVGLTREVFLKKIAGSELLARNFGSLQVPGGTVSRQVWIQGFGDLVKELRLGTLFTTQIGQPLPDNTGELDPLEGRTSQANSMVFSPDGRFALFGSADKTVRLWDIDANREIRRFVGHSASVWCVAFSPDGQQALSGGADNVVRLWEVATGRELRKLDGHTALITSVAFSPDGKQALSSSYDETVVLWDLKTGQELRRIEGVHRYINAVAFAPDGRRILLAGEKSLRLWDVSNGKEVAVLEGHTNAIVSLAFSADGKQALSGSDDRTVRLWDLEAKKQVRVFEGHTGPVKSVAFSPDGKRILSGGSDATVRLWDLETGKELARFGKHTEPVISVAFASGGGHTLSASNDSAIRIWDLAKALRPPSAPNPPNEEPRAPIRGELQPKRIIPVGAAIGSLLLSPDGKALYYLDALKSKAARLDVPTWKRTGDLELAERSEALFQSRDGKGLYAIASVHGHGKRPLEGKIQVIDPESFQLRKSFVVGADPYDGVATDEGRVYISGGSGEWTDIAVIDVKQETIVARWGGVWTRSFLKLSPNQERLFFSSQGVSPGTLDALQIPVKLDDKPSMSRSPARNGRPLGGDFVVTPDAQYLLFKTGTVVKLAAVRDEDLQPVALLEPFLAAVVSPEGRAVFVLSAEGTLKHYSYPEFKLRGTYRIGAVGYQAVLDSKQGRLYVAGFDPQVLAQRPPAGGFGDIYVYDVTRLLSAQGK